jgi:hypothetical protein
VHVANALYVSSRFHMCRANSLYYVLFAADLRLSANLIAFAAGLDALRLDAQILKNALEGGETVTRERDLLRLQIVYVFHSRRLVV